tara:strand:- start:195 stop:329 length:135 start_codon:yes stop_codon:yes gene_type:complete
VGWESRYLFNPKGLERARTYLETASVQWNSGLARLKMFAEQPLE